MKHVHPASLGIRGMPSEIALLQRGRAYALSIEDPELRLATLANAAAASLRQPVPVSVLADAGTALVEALAAHDIDMLSPSLRHLLVLRRQHGFDATLTRHGVGQLIEELDHFGLPPNSLVIMAPGDALFTTSDNDLRRRLRRWLRSRHVTLLLLCAGALPTTAALPFDIEGVAEIRGCAGEARWITRYWKRPGGEMLSPEYPLSSDHHRLDVRFNSDDIDIAGGAAEDEERVLVTDNVLRAQLRVPTLWERFGSLEMLRAAAAGAIAATCVLGLEEATRFRDVAETAYLLRSSRGPRLKIIVYSAGAALRQRQEGLLISLGANAIVRGSFPQLLALVPALRGQRHTRPLPADINAALLDDTGDAARGYLDPATFCETVTMSAHEVAALQLESVLVRLRLQQSVSPLSALQQLKLTRSGDVATATLTDVYVFLAACAERDVDTVIDRAFGNRVAELFDSQLRFPTNTAAQIEVQRLALSLSRQPAPDLTAQLPTTSQTAPAPRPTVPMPSNTVTGQVQLAEVTPRRLQPQPLRLRGTGPT